jgi:hypothetical protein
VRHGPHQADDGGLVPADQFVERLAASARGPLDQLAIGIHSLSHLCRPAGAVNPWTAASAALFPGDHS